MKMRCTISIDFEADDFMDAGDKARKLDNVAKELAKDYETVTFDVRERRDFKGKSRGKRMPEKKRVRPPCAPD